MGKRNISRRDFIAAMGIGALSTPMLADLMSASRGGERRPNIVLIVADDMGYECCGAYGGTSYDTPALDELARTGARFEHCYSQPLCTPSRVQIMTGMYNVRNYIDFERLDRNQITFARLLSSAGYATCVAGKWQLGGGLDAPKRFGFDEYCLWNLTRRLGRYPNPRLEINGKEVNFKNGEYGPDIVSDYICDFMERMMERAFFVYYPMILVHWPFEPTPDSVDWNPKKRGDNRKGNPKYFAGMVAYADKVVGKIVKKLESLDLRSHTLMLFTADNGADQAIKSMMGDREVTGGKGNTTDSGTHVPLIANWPAVITKGTVLRDLVDFTDFLPSICECAGVSIPENLEIDGKSFLPQLSGETGTPRAWVYSWFSKHGRLPAREFARSRRYKLYRNGKFYDLEQDVLERKPLDVEALDSKTAAVRDMLQEVLDRYRDARPERLR